MTHDEFKPAVRENVSTITVLAGASGSGKTYSALRLAKGMAPRGKIAFVDTEARRGLHYAGQFDFLHCDMRPPFAPENFAAVLHNALNTAPDVVVFDSFSHEYDGEGGIVEWAAALEATGEARYKSPANWKEPKIAHRRLVNAFLQSRAHLIFCLRADEKIEIVPGDPRAEAKEDRRTKVRSLGWVPITEKRFMYEATASFTLQPDKPGRPFYNLPHKLQEQHRPMFPEGACIDENAGRALAEWARGGMIEPAPWAVALLAQGHEIAERGTELLKAFWENLTPQEKQAIGPAQLESWKRIAADAKVSA